MSNLRILGLAVAFAFPAMLFTTPVCALHQTGAGSGEEQGTEASAFGSRSVATATRRQAAPPAGATKRSEEAVLAGLCWLLRHQNEDGSWGVDTLASHCTPRLWTESCAVQRRTPVWVRSSLQFLRSTSSWPDMPEPNVLA